MINTNNFKVKNREYFWKCSARKIPTYYVKPTISQYNKNLYRVILDVIHSRNISYNLHDTRKQQKNYIIETLTTPVNFV